MINIYPNFFLAQRTARGLSWKKFFIGLPQGLPGPRRSCSPRCFIFQSDDLSDTVLVWNPPSKNERDHSPLCPVFCNLPSLLERQTQNFCLNCECYTLSWQHLGSRCFCLTWASGPRNTLQWGGLGNGGAVDIKRDGYGNWNIACSRVFSVVPALSSLVDGEGPLLSFYSSSTFSVASLTLGTLYHCPFDLHDPFLGGGLVD